MKVLLIQPPSSDSLSDRIFLFEPLGLEYLGAGLQFEPVTIECAGEIKQGAKGNAKLILQKPIAFNKSDSLAICDLNSKGLRAIAGAKPI